jgi:hypothetical protein
MTTTTARRRRSTRAGRRHRRVKDDTRRSPPPVGPRPPAPQADPDLNKGDATTSDGGDSRLVPFKEGLELVLNPFGHLGGDPSCRRHCRRRHRCRRQHDSRLNVVLAHHQTITRVFPPCHPDPVPSTTRTLSKCIKVHHFVSKAHNLDIDVNCRSQQGMAGKMAPSMDECSRPVRLTSRIEETQNLTSQSRVFSLRASPQASIVVVRAR